MDKKLNDFIKSITKLTDYYIIREEDKYVILATNLTRTIHINKWSGVFHHYTANKPVAFQVFFVICLKKDIKELQALKDRNVLILEISEDLIKAPIEEIHQYLELWVNTKFNPVM